MTNYEEVVSNAKTRPMPFDWLAVGLSELRHSEAGKSGVYRNGFKRILDVAIAIIVAPFILPLIAIFALLVYLTDGGNPFFLQERVGAGGRIFRMWKLRTMSVDAEERLQAVLDSDPELTREWAHSQKMRRDPRITRIGRFLRKSSIDELPQLFNVFRGEMSLVGPRPMMPDQQSLYPGSSYYRMRPGITGLWQVSERNLSSFAERARFDQDYDKQMSMLTDLRVMVETVRVVFRGTGC
ncbi:MAG: sugar transferase [Pseudooceanicola sp.]